MLIWREKEGRWESIEPPPEIVELALKSLEPGYELLKKGDQIRGGDKYFYYSFEKKEGGWNRAGDFGKRVGDNGYTFIYCRRKE